MILCWRLWAVVRWWIFDVVNERLHRKQFSFFRSRPINLYRGTENNHGFGKSDIFFRSRPINLWRGKNNHISVGKTLHIFQFSSYWYIGRVGITILVWGKHYTFFRSRPIDLWRGYRRGIDGKRIGAGERILDRCRMCPRNETTGKECNSGSFDLCYR